MSKLTLQLNSVAAVEALIGGDTEVEVELRKSVVAGFTRKHLKQLANSEFLSDAVHEVKLSVQEIVTNKLSETIGSLVKQPNQYSYRDNYAFKLNDKTVEAIEREVRNQAVSIVGETINRAIAKASFFDQAYIKQAVDKKFNEAFNAAVTEAVNKKLLQLKAALG